MECGKDAASCRHHPHCTNHPQPPQYPPCLMRVIQSRSPRSLIVPPIMWTAQLHLDVLRCTFVDVTRNIPDPYKLSSSDKDHVDRPDTAFFIVQLSERPLRRRLRATLRAAGFCLSKKIGLLIPLRFGHFKPIEICGDFLFQPLVSCPTKQPAASLSPGTLLNLNCMWDLWEQRNEFVFSKSRLREQRAPRKIYNRLKPDPEHHDPYLVAILLAMAQNAAIFLPSDQPSPRAFPVHALVTDGKHGSETASVRIYSALVPPAYLAAFCRPEHYALPPLVIRCATVFFFPADTFLDHLRGAIVAENAAVIMAGATHNLHGAPEAPAEEVTRTMGTSGCGSKVADRSCPAIATSSHESVDSLDGEDNDLVVNKKRRAPDQSTTLKDCEPGTKKQRPMSEKQGKTTMANYSTVSDY